MGEHKRPRREPSLYRTRLGEQLRFGMVVGLELASLYCAYVAVFSSYAAMHRSRSTTCHWGMVLARMSLWASAEG